MRLSRVDHPRSNSPKPKAPDSSKQHREDDKDVRTGVGKTLPDTIYNAYVLKFLPSKRVL